MSKDIFIEQEQSELTAYLWRCLSYTEARNGLGRGRGRADYKAV